MELLLGFGLGDGDAAAWEALLEAADIDPRSRAEDLPGTDWLRLYELSRTRLVGAASGSDDA